VDYPSIQNAFWEIGRKQLLNAGETDPLVAPTGIHKFPIAPNGKVLRAIK
jgi:hypothetical protein